MLGKDVGSLGMVVGLVGRLGGLVVVRAAHRGLGLRASKTRVM